MNFINNVKDDLENELLLDVAAIATTYCVAYGINACLFTVNPLAACAFSATMFTIELLAHNIFRGNYVFIGTVAPCVFGSLSLGLTLTQTATYLSTTVISPFLVAVGVRILDPDRHYI